MKHYTIIYFSKCTCVLCVVLSDDKRDCEGRASAFQVLMAANDRTALPNFHGSDAVSRLKEDIVG